MYVTPGFAGHYFRVDAGGTWYFFANLPLRILIFVQSQILFVVMQVEL